MRPVINRHVRQAPSGAELSGIQQQCTPANQKRVVMRPHGALQCLSSCIDAGEGCESRQAAARVPAGNQAGRADESATGAMAVGWGTPMRALPKSTLKYPSCISKSFCQA
jgi:hypothetical protein